MNNLKNKIFALAKDDLSDIEKALAENLHPNLEIISKAAEHILFSGGKRLRPLLMVGTAKLCGKNGHYDIKYSTIFEYLHAATLLHDDLIDNASLRRGKTVAHKIFGNSTTILVGDFLLARALSIAAETKQPKVIQIIAKVTEEMAQGEIQQLMTQSDLNITEEKYMEVIRKKTSVLFEGACQVSAIIVHASEEEETAIARYGFNIGIAFQMADDLLDYTSDTQVLGKEVGADLKEGKITLPVIYALNNANAKDKKLMEDIITSQSFTKHNFEILKEFIVKYKGIEYTQKLAEKYVDRAKKSIDIFKPSKYKDLFIYIADYTLARKQ